MPNINPDIIFNDGLTVSEQIEKDIMNEGLITDESIFSSDKSQLIKNQNKALFQQVLNEKNKF